MGDFRGIRKETGKWVCGFYYKDKTTGMACIIAWEDGRDRGCLTIEELREVRPETVGQFTGLHDGTKWEELTDAEKLDFYKQHYIGEDGMSVRFQHVDDVRFLWKGKQIFEGDIVEPVLTGGTHKGFSWGKQLVVFDRGAFCLKDRRGEITPMCNYAANVQFKVWGNIHDNPELLEVSE